MTDLKLVELVKILLNLIGDADLRTLGLLSVVGQRLQTPLFNDTLSLFSYRVTSGDELPNLAATKDMLGELQDDATLHLNHVGFCYMVDSKDEAIDLLIRNAKNANIPLYEEPSSDGARWIFAGNIMNNNPLLEFLPHESTSDRWADLWLPHMQFDIDTGLSSEEIKRIVRKHFGREPYAIVIEGTTYIQRLRIGRASGINLSIDLATNSRDPSYRQTLQRLC